MGGNFGMVNKIKIEIAYSLLNLFYFNKKEIEENTPMNKEDTEYK